MIGTEPSSKATAGQAFGTQPVVYEEDQFGNVETSDNSAVIAASLASGSGPLHGLSRPRSRAGWATFTDLFDDRAEKTSLRFTSGGLNSVVANNTAVAASPATQLVVTSPPPNILRAGQALNTTVSAEDQFGNLDASYSQEVTISVPGDPGFDHARAGQERRRRVRGALGACIGPNRDTPGDRERPERDSHRADHRLGGALADSDDYRRVGCDVAEERTRTASRSVSPCLPGLKLITARR